MGWEPGGGGGGGSVEKIEPDGTDTITVTHETGPVVELGVTPGTYIPSTGPGVWLPAPTGVAATDTAVMVAAQTVLAALPTGGTIHGQDGTYVHTPMVHDDHVIFAGDGAGLTVWQLAAGSNADQFTSVNFAANVGTTANGPSYFGFRDCTVDGNGANQTAGPSINWRVYGYNLVYDNVRFINGYSGGVYFQWGGSGLPEEGFGTKFRVYNYGYVNGSVGFEFHGAHDSQFANGVVATQNSNIFNATSGSWPAYGATPISGGTVVPQPGTTFTFACTGAQTTFFPLTGGMFLLPVTSSAGAPTWTLITYTASSVTSGAQTFTGCMNYVSTNSTLNVVASQCIILPTWGLLDSQWSQNAVSTGTDGSTTLTFNSLAFNAANGSVPFNGAVNGSIQVGYTVAGPGITGLPTVQSISGDTITLTGGTITTLVTGSFYFFTAPGNSGGAQFDTVHVWGRNHIGWYTSNSEWSFNCESEGAFIANLVIDSVLSIWKGSVYGTFSQSGQPNEVGLQIGHYNNTRTNTVEVVNFNVGNSSGGYPVNITSRSGGQNKIVSYGSSTATIYVQTPYTAAGGDWYECVNHTNTGLDVFSAPFVMGFPAGLTAYTRTAGDSTTYAATTAFVAAVIAPDKPQDFGYFGWTNEPEQAGYQGQPATGRVYLVRFRCVTSGTVGHLGFTVTTGGSGLTASDSFVGIYDTGQTTPGSATLLGVSADQSTNFATAAVYSASLTAQSAGSLALVAGQDYFAALLAVDTTTAPKLASALSGNASFPTFANLGLTGLSIRNGRYVTSAQTSLPGAITAANILANDTGAFPYCFVAQA